MGGGFPDLNRRFDYEWGTLSEEDLGYDPLPALRSWLAEAESEGMADFNAMVLATVGADGRPSTRNVLLRDIDDAGRLSFFTNRRSRKGREMAGSSAVSLLFSWLPMHRQVRVDGDAAELDDDSSDEYFRTRPEGSRIAAWASPQSEVIESRDELEEAFRDQEARFAGSDVPRPPFWGGYAVTPIAIEFWQGRPSRLHDRVRFVRPDPGSPWTRERLAP
jgi:pyridoxamine 5'-phosphate oxidase